jgi:hypothetical protein
LPDDGATTLIAERSAWYGREARTNKRAYQLLKAIQLLCAAAIPIISLLSGSIAARIATAVLAAVIGLLEALSQLKDYQKNWLGFRAAREALKREDLLFSAKAGPNRKDDSPELLYVERCDSIISGESAKWIATQQKKEDGSVKGSTEADHQLLVIQLCVLGIALTSCRSSSKESLHPVAAASFRIRPGRKGLWMPVPVSCDLMANFRGGIVW